MGVAGARSFQLYGDASAGGLITSGIDLVLGTPGPLERTGGVVTGPHNPSNFNAIVGWEAFGQTTGGGHTGLGASAGRSLTGGSGMIFIGRNAGYGEGQKVDATGLHRDRRRGGEHPRQRDRHRQEPRHPCDPCGRGVHEGAA